MAVTSIDDSPSVIPLIRSLQQKNIQNAEDKASILASAKELVRQLESPGDRAFDLIFTIAIVPCLQMACDMGVFRMLQSEPVLSAKLIAERAGAEEEFVVRIMRTLVSVGVVDLEGPRVYRATPVANMYAIPWVAGGVAACRMIGQACDRLPEYTRLNGHRSPETPEDGPWQFAHNTTDGFFTWLNARPREANDFNTYMAGFKEAKKPWVDTFPAEEIICGELSDKEISEATIVDIGGGYGHDLHLLRNKLRVKPGRLVAQDLDVVVSAVPAEYRHNVEHHAYDFFTPQPIAARTYVLKHILHDWPHAHAVRILKNVKAAMKPGYSKIVIVDLVLPEHKVPLPAAGLDLVMMAGFTGAERTEELWRTLIEDAGLRLHRIERDGDSDGLLEVVL